MDWKECMLVTFMAFAFVAFKWLMLASAIFVPLWLIFC